MTRGRSVTAPLRPPHVRPFHSPEFHEFPFDLVIALSFHSFYPILRYSDPNYGFRAWWINSESRRRGGGEEKSKIMVTRLWEERGRVIFSASGCEIRVAKIV